MKKGFIIGFLSAAVVLSALVLTNIGASFSAYAPKLLRFEGKGYGIDKPVWGYRSFTRTEALRIHKHHYWNRYYGDLFDNQAVAEVFIDHLINAGDGRTKQNIKAFEKIIGADVDGVISREDVYLANTLASQQWIVNQYVDYRVSYYKSLKSKKYEAGWLKRARSFRVFEDQDDLQDSLEFDLIEDIQEYVVLNPVKPVQINGTRVDAKAPAITDSQINDVIEDL